MADGNKDLTTEELLSNSGKQLYTYYDEAGNRIGSGFLSSGTDTSKIVGQTVSPTASGKFWALDSDYSTSPYASIKLDEDTGKITVSAPKELLDDESFKEVFDPSVLKQFSSAYQRNKDYKLADPFDESNEAKDVTIPELIEKYNSALKDFVAAMQQEKKTRADIASGEQGYSNRNDIANRLTRSDMIIMGTNALGEGANNDALIAIPKFLYKDLLNSKSTTFDSSTGMVKKGDFRENVYSLKEKDEEFINSMFNKIEDYFEEDDFEDTEEYARATALYSFLLNNDPDASPGQISNYVTSSLAKGAGINFRKTLLGLGDLITTVLTFGGNTHGPINALREQFESGLEDIEKEKAEAEEFLTRMSTAGKVALGVGEVGETLAEIFIPSMAAGKVAKGATIAKAASKAEKGAEAATKIGTLATTVAASAEELATGADLLIAANNATKAAELASKAAIAQRTASTTRALGTAADLAAQTITEAVIYDPVVFAKVLQGQEKSGIQAGTYDDAYGYLLETAAWNIGGWGAFSVGAKGVKSFGKTKAGRYTNAVAQKWLNKVPVYTGSLGEKILKLRYGDEWLSGSKSARTNEARKYNYELRQAQKVVASQKIGLPSSKKVAENVKKQEKNIVEMMNLHNATDAVQRGANAYIRRMLDSKINPILSGYEQKLRALGAKITKAERRAGLSTRRKIFRREDAGSVRVFSEASANYIGARTQLDVLKNIKRVRGSLTEAQKKGEAILKKMLKDSKAKLPKEVQQYLEEYLAWDRKFWQEYNNLRVAEGSLNATQIAELRAEGYWGKNGELYRPSYRVDPDRETKLVRNDERVARDNDTSTEQYVWGSDKKFMDPEVARYMAMGDAGATLNATRYVEAVNAIPSTKAHVVYDAEEVARAQRMKEFRAPLSTRIKDATRGIFASGKIATGKSAERTLRLNKLRADYIRQAGKVERSKLAVNRMAINKIKLNATERRTTIGAMDQAQLEDVLTEAGITFDFSKMRTPEEFEDFYNSLDKTTQKYVQQKMGNVAGILYPATTEESALERAITKASSQDNSKGYYTVDDLLSGKASPEARTELAQKVVKNSNGEKFIAWRTQDEGVGDFHGSAGGSGNIIKSERERWKGGRWINVGGRPWTIGGYGEQKLIFPINKSDILDEFTWGDYSDSARELYTIKYGEKLDKDLYRGALEELGKTIEDLPHYAELASLNKKQLKKLVDGDPRVALDVSGKKIIKYDSVGRDRQFVLFPDRNPELLRDGIKEMSDLSMAEAGVQTSLVKSAPYITAENYNKLAQADPSFVPNLKKSLVQNRKDLRNSSVVTKVAEDAKRAQYTAEREGLYRENMDELKRITKEGLTNKDEEAILAEFDEGITEYIDLIYGDKKLAKTIDDVIDQSGTVDKEAAREYIALEEIIRDDTQELKEIRAIAREEYSGNPEAAGAYDLFERMFNDKIYERRNIARQKLADEGSTLVDRKRWMEEIRKIDKDITGKLAEPGYISIPNAKGEMEIWEVDPIAADLYKYAAKRPDMSTAAKFFNETSKIFRLGTTGMNLLSFVNQSFRDFGNLWLTSGSYHMVNLSRSEMVNLFGPEIATWYRREEPEIYKQLVELAEKQGKPIEKMVIERELAIGRQTSTQATETAMLKTVGEAGDIRKISKGEMSRTSQTIDRVVDALSTPNEWRERYFRNIVYADSLNQAIKRGYTLKEARTQAEFMMNNATTNFSRELVHLQGLQRTVPYIGAAVNGTKSFFRILSVDPVGVMSRFVGGFVIPVMALTGMALGDPATRKKYEQLNEYEKDNNIIVPMNGSLLKIPIPQEVGPLVKPWQHLVEKMYSSNRHDFWELMLNDALGISPMDITGFYDLDEDAMENPTIWDRLLSGTKQLLVGQMAPPPVKSAYMLFTGEDPYTGKFIDTSYQYYDYDSGEVLVMDSSTSAFAKAMADTFGGPASVIAAAVNAVVGRSGMDVLDSFVSALQYAGSGGEEGSLTTIFERAGEAISKPVVVADYDRTKTAWNREISKLYREKEGIQNSARYKEIEEAINKETDVNKRRGLQAQRDDMLADWRERTKVAINKLQDNFGGTIDRFRLASLISLLNMHESTGGITPVGRGANDELYYEGRDEAIRTLIDMGATSTGDGSILGYVTRVRQDDGSYVDEVKFYKPLEILAMQNAWYGNASVSASYIEELLENGAVDYKARKKAVKQQIDAIYNKGKLSQSDYNAINAIKINWNSEVMQAIAPYIERVTPESAINDDEVIQYLKQFIYVPDDIKVDKRGYHVTNKSLAGGNANEAYIKKFLQSAYGINDTGYSGGINYSGRKTLGGE